MPTEQNAIDNNYYNVDVCGDYFVATSEGNSIRPFGVVTLKMRIWHDCQSLCMFHLVPALLSKSDTEFKKIRRCVVIGVKTHDGQMVHGLPIKFMSREQIAMEVKSNNIPLRVDMYNDIIKLRSRLHDARRDPDKFKQQEQRSIQAFCKIGDAIDLNADVFKLVAESHASSDHVNLLNKENSLKVPVQSGVTDLEKENAELKHQLAQQHSTTIAVAAPTAEQIAAAVEVDASQSDEDTKPATKIVVTGNNLPDVIVEDPNVTDEDEFNL